MRVGVRYDLSVQTGFETQLASYSMSTMSVLGLSKETVLLTVHPILKSRCEQDEVLLPPPFCARTGMSRGDLHCNNYLFVNYYLFKEHTAG
jgi:hypothetical protein